MPPSKRLRFFNFFRNFFRILRLEPFLATLTRNKGYNNFFVKCLPQNYQYPFGSFHLALRNGIQYRLDLSEYMEWVIYFELSVEHRSPLYSLIKEGMTIFDIGTNVGETALNFARITGPQGMVYGFEPVDENYRKCLDNISLNAFKNIAVSNHAISDKQEVLYFRMADNNNSGSIFMKKNKVENNYEVTAMPLDDFITQKEIHKADLLKIDVEGFETNIIKGAINTLLKFKPVLFVEVDDENLNRQGSSSKELIALIRSCNYDISIAGETNASNDAGSHFDIICRPAREMENS